jgi:hypothetical protein
MNVISANSNLSNSTLTTSFAALLRSTSTAVIVSAAIMLSVPAQAASTCKGLNDNACASAQSCSWIKAYQRKDGINVTGFCRTKSKSASKKAAVKKATAKKAPVVSSKKK